MSKLFWLTFINQLTTICMLLTYIHQTYSEVQKTNKILESYGYTVESHTVTTKDGYELVIYRIPVNREGMESSRNYPVLIQHCLFGSSADWVLAGRKRSLPMQLVDEGYDVWLANSRGSPYSRGHEELNDKDKAYWDFTVHDLGVFDLPAIIDFMLQETGKKHIHHIGNSMSTATFYIMASEKPTYQSAIRSHISLAPVSKLGNSKSLFKTFTPFGESLNNLFQNTSNGEFLAEDSFVRKIITFLCKNPITKSQICIKLIIDPSFGADPKYFDKNLLSVITDHFPVSTSAKLFLHMSQFMNTDSFAQFNYGPAGNQEHYNGSNVPPSYDLTKIKVPITLFYATNDLMSTKEDVDNLKNQLPNLANVIEIEDQYFNHIGFLWSKVVTEVVNNPIKDILNETDDPKWKNKDVPNMSRKTLCTAAKKDLYDNEQKMIKNINDFFSGTDL